MCHHPGFYLRQKLEEAEMSQKELSSRIGVSEKLISLVNGGDRNISASLARKLGYVFENANFWLNKQAEYDAEQQKKADEHNIEKIEIDILKELKIITPYFFEKKWIHNNCGDIEKVLQYREFLQVSNLTLIPQVTYNAAYRAQVTKNININPYVLFAWQRMCEKEVENYSVASSLNINKLEQSIPEIKSLMALDINSISKNLVRIFRDCGIVFKIVKNFRGAPVQGFIKALSDKLLLCITLRGKNADRFWFTLFHEIAHIVNGDYNKRFVDFDSVSNVQEEKADEWARDHLIDPVAYKSFIFESEPTDLEELSEFAKKNNVPAFIVIGRLQKDKYLEYSDFQNQIRQYEFEDIK